MFFFLIPFYFILAQGQELEVKYPAVEGVKPETINFPLAEYVKYIFNFVIATAGLIALLVLIWSGVQYLTSAGKPDVLTSAKSRIKSALFGILLLLFSYLILITINPQLVIFQFPGLPEIPSTQLPATPISPLITSDLLGRIKEMAEAIKKIPNEIKAMAEKIQELTNKCDCQNTQSLCMCTGGDKNAKCQSQQCYAGPGSHPCPDLKEIKDNQKRIIAWKDEILYYRNRALAEAEDLKDNIEEILDKKIDWYNTKIAAEEKVLAQVEGESAKALQQRLIDYLKEERDWLTQERDYKEDLQQKLNGLNELAETIAKIEEPVNEISQLPDKCLVNVGDINICKPTCKGECHDYKSGCQPDKCAGGNPCPTNEIQSQVGKINPLPQEIIRISDEIIAIIDNIKETQSRKIQL